MERKKKLKKKDKKEKANLKHKVSKGNLITLNTLKILSTILRCGNTVLKPNIKHITLFEKKLYK